MRRTLAVGALLCLVGCGDCGDGTGGGSNDPANNTNLNNANNANNGTNANNGSNNTTGEPMRELPFGECAGDGAPPPLPAVACFGDVEAPDVDNPIAVIEHAYEDCDGVPAVYIRVTFNPAFVDNTYGVNSMGWEDDREFDKMVGSDHAQMVALDASGEVIFDLKLDYLGEVEEAVCGYESKGIDKDGEVITGEEGDVLKWRTSMDRNFNENGYCDYLEDSPATDENCTPNPDAPNWDYRVVYEVWLRRSAFEPEGFGTAHMTSVHASPAKGGENTVDILRQDCPCPTVEHECRDFPASNNNTNSGTNNDIGQPGDACTSDGDCGDNAFCYEGTCLNVIL